PESCWWQEALYLLLVAVLVRAASRNRLVRRKLQLSMLLLTGYLAGVAAHSWYPFGSSLDGQIVAVSVAAAATGGIAVGAAVVKNTMSTQNSLTLGATSNPTQPLANPSLRSSADLNLLSQGRNRINRTQAITVTGAGGASFGVAGALNFASAEVSGRTQTLVNSGRLDADRIDVDATAQNSLDSSAYGGSVAGGADFGAGFGYFQAFSTLGQAGEDPEIEARLGDDVTARARTISLSTNSADRVLADSVSAALGIGYVAVALAGAQSRANTHQTLRTAIGDQADLRASEAINLGSNVDQSNRDGTSNEIIDSRAQGIAVAIGIGVAGGGAGTDNMIASEGQITVGKNARLVAPQLNLASANRLSKNQWGASDSKTGQTFGGDANTRSVAGSVIGVAINPSSTQIGTDSETFGSSIRIDDGALLRATGSTATPGRLNLSSNNDIFATDLNILDAVSGFGLTYGHSELTNRAKASIDAGKNSRVLNDSGDVMLSSSGNATISSSSSAFSGLVGEGAALAKASNKPTQSITLDGAQIEGNNIQLWSGLSATGVPNILRTVADARNSVLLLGEALADATAETADINSITIKANSELLARANVDLRAQEKFGTRGPDARSSAEANISLALAIPITGSPTITDTTTNTISIDKDAQITAGLQHDLKLWTLPYGADLDKQSSYLGVKLPNVLVAGQPLNDGQMLALGLDPRTPYVYEILDSPAGTDNAFANLVGVVLPERLWQNTPPQLSYLNLGSNLNEQYRQLQDLIVSYQGDPAQQALYNSQAQDVLAQANRLGLLDPETGTINESLDSLALMLPALRSAPGSIFLNAAGDDTITVNDQAFSTTSAIPSNLLAFAEANIAVNNVLPIVMVGADMLIDDSRVSKTVAGTYTVFDPGKIYVNDKPTAAKAAAPANTASQITIIQAPDKSLTYKGQQAPVPADLYITGSVVNANGGVSITNTTDNIVISGEVRGNPVNISSAGDFTLNSKTWQHIGKDPSQYLDYQTLYFNQASNQPGQPVLVQQATLKPAIDEPTAAILSRGNISINALYLNINGLIQSGTPNLKLDVAKGFNPAVSQSIVGQAGAGIAGIAFASSNGTAVPLTGMAMLSDHTIHLDDINVTGGSVQLTGQILSTGNGRVLALNGQPSLTINNDSDWN
ncbi:MAG: hypothetical protein WCH37_04545, partial [Synechococcaceae cyanobacterium ELA182]